MHGIRVQHYLYGGIALRTEFQVVPPFSFQSPHRSWFVDGRAAGLPIIEFKPNEFVHDAVQMLGLMRLNYVHQLSYLTSFKVKDINHFDAPNGKHIFDHHRLEHVLLAAAIAAKLASNYQLNEHDSLVVILAALTHDAMMPAGGDTMKTMAPAELDEDRNYVGYFDKLGNHWRVFRKKYGLREHTFMDLRQAIRGRELAGHILEIADTVSYLALDSRAIMRRYREMPPQMREEHEPYKKVFELVERGALTGWADTRLVGECPVFEPRVLGRMLHLRAHLARDLYCNAEHSAIRMFMSEVAFPYLFKQRISELGEGTPLARANFFELLREWDDRSLGEAVAKILNHDRTDRFVGLFGPMPILMSFKNWDEARRFAASCERTHLTVLGLASSLNNMFSPKTDAYFVPDEESPENLVTTFARAYPGKATEINQLMQPKNPWRVVAYAHPLPPSGNVPLGLQTAFRLARRKWSSNTTTY